MTTRDTPAEALAAALDTVVVGNLDIWWWSTKHAKELAAAILAALDGWTLVPFEWAQSAWSADDVKSALAEVEAQSEAEIARLRAALADVVAWLEAEADDPRPDPTQAMRLQAAFARAALGPSEP